MIASEYLKCGLVWRWRAAKGRPECSTEIESGGDPGAQLIWTLSISAYAPLSSDVQTTKMSTCHSVVWYKQDKYQLANISTWTAICTCDYARDPKFIVEVKFSYLFILLLIKITISMSLTNLYECLWIPVEVACAHMKITCTHKKITCTYEDHMCT